ncbi:MAG: Eco57I restriction-modification methylase domain-containing protein [Clostridia bacterium]|nr:Eco57I restriction-modification methylase domain-containing protein [Clostridia bacterium]
MKYYALFLNNNQYIEKCLTLIKYICNPNSKSLPHITLRPLKNEGLATEYIEEIMPAYLNLIEPGAFNLDMLNESTNYVVFLRCESEELEKIDYKPDYPFSRLHLTLYEGKDYTFATKLYNMLLEIDWNYKLKFSHPQKLVLNTIGRQPEGNSIKNIENLVNDLLPYERVKDFNNNLSNQKYKISYIKSIIEGLNIYIKKSKAKKKGIAKSVYLNQTNSSTENKRQENFVVSPNGEIYYEDKIFINKDKANIYVTPPEYAREMVSCAMEFFYDEQKEIHFGDPTIGNGALYLALLNQNINEDYLIKTATGIDINEDAVRDASTRYQLRGLEVILGDAISTTIKIPPQRNLILANPPYNRHEDISTGYLKVAKECAKLQTGIDIPGDASLYVYHLLIMDKWLKEGGVASWLIPSLFLQTKYGRAIREYLLNNVQLMRLHIYKEQEGQFEKANVSTCIVTFKKCKCDYDYDIEVSYGYSSEKPEMKTKINSQLLKNEKTNWRNIILNGHEGLYQFDENNRITFADLFDIKRGIATGANSYFVLDRGKAVEYEIPEVALKPILPKSRFLESNIIDSDDKGYPLLEQQLVIIDSDMDEEYIKNTFPKFYEYLQLAKIKQNDGKRIIDRTLVKSREPWYKQETRLPPPFLMTYMGRGSKNKQPIYFLWNKSNAIALNTYILLYPKSWLMDMLKRDNSLYDILLSALNYTAENILPNFSRIYAGGLKKIEPGELLRVPIANLPNDIKNSAHKYLF